MSQGLHHMLSQPFIALGADSSLWMQICRMDSHMLLQAAMPLALIYKFASHALGGKACINGLCWLAY